MALWWFMLACNVLIPLLLIVGGWVMWKLTPKKINGFSGYRTSRSMKNEKTWKFANEYCGRLLWYAGWDTLLVFAAGQLLHRSEAVIGLVSVALELVDLVPVFVSIGLTEKALKRTFTEAGELR